MEKEESLIDGLTRAILLDGPEPIAESYRKLAGALLQPGVRLTGWRSFEQHVFLADRGYRLFRVGFDARDQEAQERVLVEISVSLAQRQRLRLHLFAREDALVAQAAVPILAGQGIVIIGMAPGEDRCVLATLLSRAQAEFDRRVAIAACERARVCCHDDESRAACSFLIAALS